MKNDYDIAAAIYDPLLFLALKPVRITVMKELLPYKDKAILDLCCGTGNQLKLLSKSGFNDLHCLDISDSMLKVAKRSCCEMKIYNKDATETGFEDQSFDIVMLSFAIHEKDRVMQEKLLAEAYRLLKKEGLLLIVDFIFDHKTKGLSRMGIRIVERIAGKEHYNNFKNYIKENGLSSLLKKDRFELVKAKRKLLNGLTISIYKKR
jgi:ubiquinone/menaquinone biosynthesis C-methylase UbiE